MPCWMWRIWSVKPVDARGRSTRDPESRFWFAFLDLGFAVLIAESVMTEVYVATTPDGPHRTALAVIAAASGLAGAANIAAVRWISRQSWRHPYSVIWTLIAGATVAVSIWLDGGLSSPLLLLLLLPVMYAGLAFSPRAVVICTIASLAELGLLAMTDLGSDERPGALLVAMSAAIGIGLIASMTTWHRWRLQRRTAELTQALEIMAATDGLTGCLNHRAFAERVDLEIERALRYGQPLSLVIADVDHLKRVNDEQGHAAGDATLRTVAGSLQSQSRQSDSVARIGGDEFALLLPATGLDAAAQLTHRLFATFIDHGPVTFSAGVAALDRSRPTREELFRDADTALYHAKRTGRAGVAVLPRAGSPVRLADYRVNALAHTAPTSPSAPVRSEAS